MSDYIKGHRTMESVVPCVYRNTYLWHSVHKPDVHLTMRSFCEHGSSVHDASIEVLGMHVVGNTQLSSDADQQQPCAVNASVTHILPGSHVTDLASETLEL